MYLQRVGSQLYPLSVSPFSDPELTTVEMKALLFSFPHQALKVKRKGNTTPSKVPCTPYVPSKYWLNKYQMSRDFPLYLNDFSFHP